MMCCTFGDNADVEKYKKYNLPLKMIINEKGCLYFDNVPEIEEKYKSRLDGLFTTKAREEILNILEEYHQIFSKEPDVVISGFHMMKKSGYKQEDIELIEKTAWKLKEYRTKFYTCHCTGEEPYERMKRILREQIDYVKSGEEVEIDNI